MAGISTAIALGTAAAGVMAAAPGLRWLWRAAQGGTPAPTFRGALKAARQRQDIEPLLAVLGGLSGEEQATRINQAVRHLWDGWERETATRLVREAAAICDAKIVHYWIQRVLEVEPELAALHFGPAFLEEQFRPDLARGCGAGGCGCG